MFFLIAIAFAGPGPSTTDLQELILAQSGRIEVLEDTVEVQGRTIADLQSRLGQLEQVKTFVPEEAKTPMSFRSIIVDPPFKGSEKVVEILNAHVPILQTCYANDRVEGNVGSFSVSTEGGYDAVWYAEAIYLDFLGSRTPDDFSLVCWSDALRGVQFPQPSGMTWYTVRIIFE